MYPVMLKLEKLKIGVFGGGKIATRKIQELVAAGGTPIVIAPEISPALQQLVTEKKIHWQERGFKKNDTTNFQLIFIATNQPVINQEILAETREDQLVNDTTEKSHSNFFNLAMLQEKDFGIAVTTFGKNPSRAKQLKLKIKELIQEL